MKPEYQPKTGSPCTCKRGQERDNCPSCEGTGWRIDFRMIRGRLTVTSPEVDGPVAVINNRAHLNPKQLQQFIAKRFKNL